MKRREFIAVTAALLVSPRRSWAQGTPRRIGYLDTAPGIKQCPSSRAEHD
jgi:putative ABC transport system substrate-binding protein